MNNLAHLNHLEIFLCHAALGANKIFRNILPLGARREPFFLAALSFIVNPTTNDALPLTHYLVPQIQIFPPLSAKRGVNYCSLAKKSNIDSSLNQMMER